MNRFAAFHLLAAALAAVSLPTPAGPAKASVTSSLAQTERVAVELRQGMSVEEVRALLGKPRRTALRDVGAMGMTPAPGTLQWVYSWEDADRASLRIEFGPRAEGAWAVTSWEWTKF